MRRVKLFIACSLDGYIARCDGGIDWLFHDADYGYAAFFESIDVVVQGRKTWETGLALCGGHPYPGKECVVLSHSRAGKSDGIARFVSGDVTAIVGELQRTRGRDIWLVGGAEVVRDFVAAGLIDEFIVSVHPILLGDGIPLFPPQAKETRLELVRCETFPSGLVQMTHRRIS